MEPAPPVRRLFVGLRVAPEAAERLVRRVRPTLVEADDRVPDGLAIYPADDLHVTLCFLGGVDEARVSVLRRVLQEELRGMVAPELWISETGGFPDMVRPRALWVGVRDAEPGEGRLAALHNRVQQAALSVGWRASAAERRRAFRPHVTVARVQRDGPRIHPAFGRLSFDQRWLPVDVELMETRPGAIEGRYSTLSAVPLVVRPG